MKRCNFGLIIVTIWNTNSCWWFDEREKKIILEFDWCVVCVRVCVCLGRCYSYSLRTRHNIHHKWQKKIWDILCLNDVWVCVCVDIGQELAASTNQIKRMSDDEWHCVWQINNWQWQWDHTATSASRTKELFYWTIDLYVLFLCLSCRIFAISKAISIVGNADGIIYLLPINAWRRYHPNINK